MKNLVITLLLTFFIVPILNAQVKKQVSTNIKKNRINVNTIEKGIKINLKSISVNDLNKLKIPVSKISKEFLNAKPISSWKVTPLKTHDAHLKLLGFYGQWTKSSWGIGEVFSHGYYSNEINNMKESFIDNHRAGPHNGATRLFPVVLQFRATAGARYILNYRLFNAHPEESVFISRGSYITEVYAVGGEITYGFIQDRSEEIYIYISPKLAKSSSGEIQFFRPSYIMGGIKIDRQQTN